MSMREIVNIGTSDFFGIVKIGLYIVFVAVILATPFIIAKRFNVDLVALFKKLMAKNRERPREKEVFIPRAHGAIEGYICEGAICEENAGENGAVVRHKNGTRKIVCAKCAAAYRQIGWESVMAWGDSFKSGSAALMLVGGSLLPQLIPVFSEGTPTLLNSVFNPFTLLIRLTIYGLAGIAIYFFLWGEHEE